MELGVPDKELEEEERPMDRLVPPVLSSKYPWLMISHGKNRQIQTFFDISSNHYYNRLIPEMCNKGVRCSSHGWWVMQDFSSDDCFLLNLVSMQKLQLPSLDPDYVYHICLLSAAPHEPNCRILFVNIINNFLMICQPGDDKFVKLYFELDEDECLISAIIFKGKFYCLIDRKFLYSLRTADLVGSRLFRPTNSIFQFTKLSMEELPWPSPPETAKYLCYLIESSGNLLLVHKIYSVALSMMQVLDFRIFQAVADYDVDPPCQITAAWRELNSIGQTTIFLNQFNSGLWCSSVKEGEPRIRGNSIYFTEQLDRRLHVFDLESRSVSITLPCPTVSTPHSSLSWVL